MNEQRKKEIQDRLQEVVEFMLRYQPSVMEAKDKATGDTVVLVGLSGEGKDGEQSFLPMFLLPEDYKRYEAIKEED